MSVKSDVCPEDDLQTFYPSEADGKNVLDDPKINSDELNSLS